MQDYTPKTDALKDRVILVTGAGDGIGAVAAMTYARHGATVVLLGRTMFKLEKIYDAIKENGGPEPAIYPLNLEGASYKDYSDMASTIEAELGQLNGILHNAAILGEATPIKNYDIITWQRVLHVNLTAPFMLTQACLPLMQTSSDPRITFTMHRVENAYWGAYGVSKAALETFMKILADELENQAVTVNAICPGEVRSPMMNRAYPGKTPEDLPNIESIMNTYLYAMDPQIKSETGQILSATE